MAIDADFLAGVIEGFYGQPWSQAERFELFDWMKQWGLNTYFYAPKDDLKHRVLWRELYTRDETGKLREVIAGCEKSGYSVYLRDRAGIGYSIFGRCGDRVLERAARSDAGAGMPGFRDFI
jgi:hypothetical protein